MFLYMIMFIKLKIINNIGEVKQINIKSRTYYFYNGIIDIKNFQHVRLLKIDKITITTDILQLKNW